MTPPSEPPREISSMGEWVAQRQLERTPTGGYKSGQAQGRIFDPRPHRDRADLAAILTFVDGDGLLWEVTCLRYRDERGWRAIKAGRYNRRHRVGNTHTAAALGFRLEGKRLAVVLAAADGHDGYPFEEPSAEEAQIRSFAHKLVDRVGPGSQ